MRGTQTDSQPAESRPFTWLRWQHTPSRGTGLRGDLNSRRVEGWQTQGWRNPLASNRNTHWALFTWSSSKAGQGNKEAVWGVCLVLGNKGLG